MRRFLFPLLCAAGLLSAGVVSAAEWRVALGVYDQVNSQKKQVGGGLAGFNEALAREICRRAAARCAFSSLEFKTILDGVAQGDYQLGFGNFLRTPEREQRVGFSAPVWRSSSRLIGTPAAAKRFAPDAGGEVQLDRLAGARVITISGTAQYRYLQSHSAARGLSIVEMSVLQDAPARLLAGEADFLLAPALSGYALIANLPDGKLQFVGPAVAEHGLGGTVHIALPKGDASIQKAVDQAIASIRADGTYQRIVRQFFPFSRDDGAIVIDTTPNKGRLGAGSAFIALAVVFVALFGVVVLLIWLDQQKVLDATNRLQDDTVPEIIRYQRLSRNLEQLRQEGERVFAVSSPQARQQALFVATLVASHPSVLDHRPAAELARQVERFLAEVLRQSAIDERAIARNYEAWQQLSAQVSLLVDDVSVQGVNLASRDLREVSAAMQVARYKLIAVVLLAALFLGVFLFFVRQTLIHPLQNIYRKLSQLSVDQPPPTFPPAHMLEIQAVEESIVELHASLVANEAARQQLELLANRDGLTGLTNRRHFMLLAEQELARAQRYRRSLTVGMADLDHFKRLNDTYGHAAGDAVLKAFAALVGDTLRQSDLSCRYGGEEFAFLFPEVGIDEARRLAERLRERFSELEIRLPDGRLVHVTFSMGLADATVLPLEGALKLADEALYEAKRSGRNRIAVAGTLSEA